MFIPLLLVWAQPAQSVRGSSCAEELQIARDALAAAQAEVEALKTTLQRHGWSHLEPQSDDSDDKAQELWVIWCFMHRRRS